MDCLQIGQHRSVNLCGITVYAMPEFHPTRKLHEHVLLLILDGGTFIKQNNDIFMLRKGDMMLLHSGQQHSRHYRCMPNTRILFVHFSAAEGDQYCLSQQNAKAWETKDDCALVATLTPVQSCPMIRQLMEMILETYAPRRTNKQRQLSSLLDVIFSQMSYLATYQQVSFGDNWLQFTCNHFSLMPQHSFSPNEMAQITNLNPRRFAAMFKKAANETFYQYQLHQKLMLAYCMIVTDSSMRIDAAAEQNGFYDVYQFSKMFKQKFGFSPSRLKKETV